MRKRGIHCWVMTMVLLGLLGGPGAWGFEFSGFADVTFQKCTRGCDPEEDPRNGSFGLGTLDFYVSETLGSVDTLVELVLEEGGEIVDLERLYLGYTFRDALRVRVGRFHTFLGFWNRMFHHGTQIQPTMDRPSFLEFEDDDGILPVHTVGVFASGRIRGEALVLEYGLMVGNGPEITQDDSSCQLAPSVVSDPDPGKILNAHLSLLPRAWEGMKVGLSVYQGRIRSDTDCPTKVDADKTVKVDVDQTVLVGALLFPVENLEFLGEYYQIQHASNLGSQEYTHTAWYALVTYHIGDYWAPYALYETLSGEKGDDYFDALGVTEDQTRWLLGLRYNISFRSSLKAEYRRVEEGSQDWNEYGLQWSLAF